MKPKLYLIVLCGFLSCDSAISQSGGQFAISQSVIATGGGSSSTGNFKVEGTVGQNLAGISSSGSVFNLRAGFWTFNAAPTAASAQISGRVLTAEGIGIRNVRVVLTNAMTGETLYTISSSLGYYSFEGVPVGQVYILSVSAKRFKFNPDTMFISFFGDLTGADFIATGN